MSPVYRGTQFPIAGGVDVGLAPLGIQQAQALAAELVVRGEADAIVSSPLQRTRETAQIVASALGLPVDIDDDFAECAFGEWDGLTCLSGDEIRTEAYSV